MKMSGNNDPIVTGEIEDRVAVQITTKPNVIQRLLGRLVGIKWIVIQVAKDK